MTQSDLIASPVSPSGEITPSRALDQFFTPEWAAEALVERYFGDLRADSRVLDAGCGRGAFLKAIPGPVTAVGIEVDESLADFARENSGREVLVGDFRTVAFPFQPTDILGNPPFRRELVDGFLQRAQDELPANGRCGFILPSYIFSFASTVDRWSRNFSIRQDALPRDLFPRIRYPLSFFLFTREYVRRLWGFALFKEAHEVGGLPSEVRMALAAGKPGRRVWAAVVAEAMKCLGGGATLEELYRAVEPAKPAEIRTWEATVRRVLQEGPTGRNPGGDGGWRRKARFRVIPSFLAYFQNR